MPYIPPHLRLSPQPFRQWCAWRLDPQGWDRKDSPAPEGEAVKNLAHTLGLSERRLYRWRNETTWLDRLEVEDAMNHADMVIWDVYPVIDDLPDRRAGGHEPGYRSRLSDKQVLALHALHLKGATIRELGRRIHGPVGYSCVESAEQAVRRGFRRLGLEHGPHLAGRFGRCKGTRQWWPNKGAPCAKFAMDGSDFCLAHDPSRREEVVAQTAKATQVRYGVAR